MKKLCKKIYENWLMIFLIIQPILDIFSYFLTNVLKVQSITGIIRLGMLITIVIVLFYKSKDKKKLILKLMPFILLYFANAFNIFRLGVFDFVEDTEYFVLTFQLPVLTILLIDYIKLRPQKIDQIKKGIYIVFVILAISIFLAFITNTYHNTYIMEGIGITGWFSSENTISMILSAVTVWAMYYSIEKGLFAFLIINVSSFLVLYTNGTKACYLTLLGALALTLYNLIINKKINFKVLKIFTIIFISIYTIGSYYLSVAYQRKVSVDNNKTTYKDKVNNSIIDKDNNKDGKDNIDIKDSITIKDNNKIDLVKVLESSPLFNKLIKIHGEDKVLKALNYKASIDNLDDYRLTKRINAKIIWNNSDFITKLFGIGYSRVNANNLDLENDLQAIFYYYGYIGFGVYISFILYFLIKMMYTFIKKRSAILDGEFVTLGALIVLLVIGGEYSGAFLRKANANIFLVMYLLLSYFKCNEILNSKKIKVTSQKDFDYTIKYFEMLYNKKSQDLYIELSKILKENKKKFIITANPETFTYGLTNESINNMLLDKNSLVVPDGIGIVKAARILGYNIPERIPGIEIAEELLIMANKMKKSIYLFGAKKEVVDNLVDKVTNDYPNIKMLGATDGYAKDKDKVMKKIIELKPDICLVALGIPIQEELIYKHLKKFEKGIFVGVGGSFDVMSGSKKRAPKIFQKLNLEWLYRIMKEPKRLKRFWNNNVKFILKTYKYKMKNKQIESEYL